jgi:hypothetical protein
MKPFQWVKISAKSEFVGLLLRGHCTVQYPRKKFVVILKFRKNPDTSTHVVETVFSTFFMINIP